METFRLSHQELSDLLQSTHEKEQIRGKLFSRKEFHEFMPDGADYAEKRRIMRAWQDMLWPRSMNVLKYSLSTSRSKG